MDYKARAIYRNTTQIVRLKYIQKTFGTRSITAKSFREYLLDICERVTQFGIIRLCTFMIRSTTINSYNEVKYL